MRHGIYSSQTNSRDFLRSYVLIREISSAMLVARKNFDSGILIERRQKLSTLIITFELKICLKNGLTTPKYTTNGLILE